MPFSEVACKMCVWNVLTLWDTVFDEKALNIVCDARARYST